MDSHMRERQAYGGLEKSPDEPETKKAGPLVYVALALVIGLFVAIFSLAYHYMGSKSKPAAQSSTTSSAPAPGSDTSSDIASGAMAFQFIYDSAVATQLLQNPVQNPQVIVINDTLSLPGGLKPLNTGTVPMNDPLGGCHVQTGGSLTEIGTAADGEVLVSYSGPMFSADDMWSLGPETEPFVVDPFGTDPLFPLPCVSGEVAFVTGSEWFTIAH